MTAFTVANYLNNAGRTETEMKQAFEDNLAATKQIAGAGGAAPTYTIAAGSITPAASPFFVETEGATATDDLTNIVQTNFPDGWIIYLRPVNAAHAVVVKHAAGGTGQIVLSNAADLTLNNATMWLALYRNGTQWQEMGRWYGTSQAGFQSFYQVAKLGQNTFTGRQEWKQGANLASASTITLGTDGNFFAVTGTAAVNALSTAPAGTLIMLKFVSAGCLLVTSSSLVLQGGSVLTRAGDTLKFLSEGSGIWREVDAPGAPRVLDIVTTNTSVANTAAATIVYQKTIEGGTLGGNRRVRLGIHGVWAFNAVQTSGASAVHGTTFSLFYGGSLVAATFVPGGYWDNGLATSYVYGSLNAGMTIDAFVSGDGAPNLQVGYLRCVAPIGTNATGGGASLIGGYGLVLGAMATDRNGTLMLARGVSAEDSTSAKSLTLTVEHSFANASNAFILEHAVLEILP